MTTMLLSPARGRLRSSTPVAMRSLLVSLVLLSLAWGAFGGWVASEHSSAAHAALTVDEPLSLDASQMYQSIADADVTITTAFLASSQPTLTPLQQYQHDIATASADIAQLRAAGGNATFDTALGKLISGLPTYTSYVAEAESQYSLGFPLTGGSFMQVASEEAHLTLLPAAKTVFQQENDAVSSASGEATGLPTEIIALLLAIITGYILVRSQRWLTRRTNRIINPGLLAATVLLVISAVWLAAGFLTARQDLDHGIGQGSGPAETLAQASIDVQQIRGDAVLNVISRSGDASFQQDFTATSKLVGPGASSLLGSAAGASSGSGHTAVVTAEQQAGSWYTTNAQTYTLGNAANYAAERTAVIGTGSGSSAAGYTALESSITKGIDADQSVFQSAAASGSDALSPLLAVVIVAALLMALGCIWGFRHRLAEYR
jgi:hypothetical protein